MRSHGLWRLVASAGLFVVVLATIGMSPASAQEAAEPAPASQEDPAAAARLLELVNRDRAAAGLHPLSARADVASVAAGWSKDMAARQVLAHNDVYFTAESRRTHSARSLGENVAYNGSVDDAHARLMASPGHRANLLSDRFRVVGIAAVHDGTVWWVTQNFVEPVVQPAAAPAPAAPAPAAPAPAAPAPAPAAPAPAAPAAGDVTVSFVVPPRPAAAPATASVDEHVTAAAPAVEQATQAEERTLALQTTASSSPVVPTAAVPGAVAALAAAAVGAAAWRRRPVMPMAALSGAAAAAS